MFAIIAAHADSKPETPLYPPPRGYVCYRAPSAITIDGKLDEVAWAKIPWSESFRDIEGDKRREPPFKTRMKMCWDNTGLYIAAELEEPHVWGTIKEHDEVIFHDNDFEVFLDPDCDSHTYAELELNALNTTWDLLLTKPYKDGGHAVHAWEIIGLKTGVHVDGTINDPSDKDRGWTIEIFWPWKGLKELSMFKMPPKAGDQWRINFSRVEWDHTIVAGKYVKVPDRKEHNWVWSPQDEIDMHRPDRWGILQFSADEPGTTKLRPDPAQPARDYLNRIYYAQFERRKDEKPYLKSLDELAIPLTSVLTKPLLEVTKNGFEASVDLTIDGKPQRWRIDHESRILRSGKIKP